MDQKLISNLIAQFQNSRLAELKMKMEGFEITLRSEAASRHAVPYQSMPLAPEAIAASYAENKTTSPAADAKETASESEIISSPMVGTFYRSPAPDAPPYVDKGSRVNSGDAICIIEAMKIMNKLEAEFSCEIVKIMAENGALVEYGSPLFEVIRR